MTNAQKAAVKITNDVVSYNPSYDEPSRWEEYQGEVQTIIQSAIEAEKKEWIKNLNDETTTTQDSFQPIIDAAVKGKDKRIAELEEQIRDSDESFKAVMEEKCGDEIHCTCVPDLRERIDELTMAIIGMRSYLLNQGYMNKKAWSQMVSNLKSSTTSIGEETP